jgi:hypothetical protein
MSLGVTAKIALPLQSPSTISRYQQRSLSALVFGCLIYFARSDSLDANNAFVITGSSPPPHAFASFVGFAGKYMAHIYPLASDDTELSAGVDPRFEFDQPFSEFPPDSPLFASYRQPITEISSANASSNEGYQQRNRILRHLVALAAGLLGGMPVGYFGLTEPKREGEVEKPYSIGANTG